LINVGYLGKSLDTGKILSWSKLSQKCFQEIFRSNFPGSDFFMKIFVLLLPFLKEL
jgi:hypothetical protein